MDPIRWQKVKRVFSDAAAMPSADRASFLEERCEGDAEMRAEIEKMLAADGQQNSRFEDNALRFFNGNTKQAMPTHIGRYKILREIGCGGMGAVYEGVFETADFSQQVALKVIKRGMDTDQIVRRFHHEQKILASLVHPNIATFLDGGMTEDDRPFYAMEFVEGRAIDDFCRQEDLSMHKRLQLFRQVCAAVQYAHQNLIIHRDLKPQNILVTASGLTKLLDFGIGKILNPDSGEEAGTATQLGMMTPAYASPEQVRGQRIGTSSDIYSLGVILYELLTGQKPYKFSANSQLEIERAVCESEPIRPSSVRKKEGAKRGRRDGGDQPQFSHPGSSPPLPVRPSQLKGDLDTIILKCLRKEPAERYASVQEFSEDIRRFIEGLPITARSQTLGYRATKFIGRNRVGVTTAALVFLSLVVGMSAAVWQANRAEQQRTIAEKRFADVRQLANNVVFKYHDAIANLPGSTAAREMLVRDALAYLDQLGSETTGDVDLQAELALAYLKMGDVQGKMYSANVGDTEGALASYRKSIALFEAVVAAKPGDIGAKDGLIQAYDNLAFLLLRAGGWDETRPLVEKALRLVEQIPKNETGHRQRTLKLIDLYLRLGDARSGIRTEALAARQMAIPLVEGLLETDANDYETVKASARIYQRMGTDHYWLGIRAEQHSDPEDARKQFERSLTFQKGSLAAAEKLSVLAPERPDTERYVGAALGNVAASLAAVGSTDEALETAARALALADKAVRDDPVDSENRLRLSDANETIANIHLRRKDDAQAIIYSLRALAIDEAIYRADNQNKEVFGRIAERHKLLAELYGKRGATQKADFHRGELKRIEAKT